MVEPMTVNCQEANRCLPPLQADFMRSMACPCLLIWLAANAEVTWPEFCASLGQKMSTVSAGWLLGEPDVEQAVAAMTHAVHLGHWQAPLRLAEWHHRGAQGLQVSRPSICEHAIHR